MRRQCSRNSCSSLARYLQNRAEQFADAILSLERFDRVATATALGGNSLEQVDRTLDDRLLAERHYHIGYEFRDACDVVLISRDAEAGDDQSAAMER